MRLLARIREFRPPPSGHGVPRSRGSPWLLLLRCRSADRALRHGQARGRPSGSFSDPFRHSGGDLFNWSAASPHHALLSHMHLRRPARPKAAAVSEAHPSGEANRNELPFAAIRSGMASEREAVRRTQGRLSVGDGQEDARPTRSRFPLRRYRLSDPLSSVRIGPTPSRTCDPRSQALFTELWNLTHTRSILSQGCQVPAATGSVGSANGCQVRDRAV